MKTNENKKLTLNKSTVAHLTGEEQQHILAGAEDIPACWENLWTIYHCNVIYTGDVDPRDQTQAVQQKRVL